MLSDEKQKIAQLESELGESDEHNTMNNLEKRWNNQQQTNQVLLCVPLLYLHYFCIYLGDGGIHFQS